MVQNLLDTTVKNETPLSEDVVPAVPEKSSEIPAKFKDPKTGALKAEELLKSYLALEKKLSERQVVSDGTDVQGTRPTSPEEYDIKIKNDLITVDPEINKYLFGLGFTTEQVQAVYDLAVEKVLPLLQDLATDYKTDQELVALEKAFGGEEQFNAVTRQISAWGEKNLEPAIFEALSGSSTGVLTMYKMMNEGGEPSLRTSRETESGDTEEKLRSLMKDPKYWKKNDPALLKRVEDGYKRLYK